MRTRRVLLLAFFVFGAVVTANASAAGAGTFEQIDRYTTDVTIEPAGTILVKETIDYDFGSFPRHGIFRKITDRVDYTPKPGYDRVYPIDVLSVTATGGASADYSVDDVDQYKQIKIGDPDKTITGAHRYVITYRVHGAFNGFKDHDELVWNAIGLEWSVGINNADAVVHAPTDMTKIGCAQGNYGSLTPCGTAQLNGSTASFAANGYTGTGLAPFQGMTFSIALPKGVVPDPKPILEERFNFSSAFRITPATGGLAGGLLALIVLGFVAMVWRFGRDRRYAGSGVDAAFESSGATETSAPLREHETPVEFTPPEGIGPGQIGTLIDFKADPLDVTATIIDLAVRGYLKIEEIEKSGVFHKADWKLTKLKPSDDLKPYERTLLDGLFESGDVVQLSDLHNVFAPRMQKVQTALMSDALSRKWFTHKPGTVRGVYMGLGVLVLVLGILLTIALAATTHAALIGTPVILGGVVMMIVSPMMRARTAKGYAVLRHVDGFRRFIDESEKRRAEFAEKKNIFSEYLPYAVVFGATKKWARAFAGLDDMPDTSSWYVSRGAFDYMVFSAAIDSFTVNTSGTLTSAPASSGGSSGFSGGGFSGGGGGGGGGGSW